MSGSLESRAVAVAELAPAEIGAMYRLFDELFVAAPDVFERDLRAKDRVILLHDPATRALQGFTTLALAEAEVQGRRVSVVYSGDTLVRPAFWGTPELPRAWLRTVTALAAGSCEPLYWLLLTSGYRTYRFLTVFFREFYPRHDHPTPPAEQALLDELAGRRYGADFDREHGIVRFAGGATPLRPGVAAVTPGRLQDPHVAFCLRRNPGHAEGDELVCLARVHPDNFTAAGQRMAR